MTLRSFDALGYAVLCCVLATNGAVAATPSIHCRGAKSPVERTICASPESLALDQEVTALYNRGLAKFVASDKHRLALSQVAYIHHRGGCAWASHHSSHPGPAVTECVRGAMEERLRALRGIVDHGGY
jgi:uncharacterized protein